MKKLRQLAVYFVSAVGNFNMCALQCAAVQDAGSKQLGTLTFAAGNAETRRALTLGLMSMADFAQRRNEHFRTSALGYLKFWFGNFSAPTFQPDTSALRNFELHFWFG